MIFSCFISYCIHCKSFFSDNIPYSIKNLEYEVIGDNRWSFEKLVSWICNNNMKTNLERFRFLISNSTKLCALRIICTFGRDNC